MNLLKSDAQLAWEAITQLGGYNHFLAIEAPEVPTECDIAYTVSPYDGHITVKTQDLSDLYYGHNQWRKLTVPVDAEISDILTLAEEDNAKPEPKVTSIGMHDVYRDAIQSHMRGLEAVKSRPRIDFERMSRDAEVRKAIFAELKKEFGFD